jgi:hypothetical protein
MRWRSRTHWRTYGVDGFRQSGRDGEAKRRRLGRNGDALSGRQRAVPTPHLMRGCGPVHGSHVAMAHCQAGLARTAASDRWDPLVSVF